MGVLTKLPRVGEGESYQGEDQGVVPCQVSVVVEALVVAVEVWALLPERVPSYWAVTLGVGQEGPYPATLGEGLVAYQGEDQVETFLGVGLLSESWVELVELQLVDFQVEAAVQGVVLAVVLGVEVVLFVLCFF